MSLPDLVLWMLIEKWTLLFGALAVVLLYIVARPRARPAWHEVGAEGWRFLVLLAAVPAFFLGAELGLWSTLLAYRAPLAFTGLALMLGAVLATLSPVPLVRPLVYFERPGRRDLVLAGVLLAAGLALAIAGPRARASAWNDLAQRAPTEVEARDEVVRLAMHRYVALDEIRPVLDATLPDGPSLLAFVAAARAGNAPELGLSLREELADRLLVELAGVEARDATSASVSFSGDAPSPTVAPLPGAVEAVWWLLGPQDADATLRAYVLTTPELRATADSEGGGVDVRRIVANAARHGTETEREVVLIAAFRPLSRRGLDQDAVDALASVSQAPDPTGRLATLILLRDASTLSLRPIAPRFADPESADWALLREECPSRSTGLERLVEDPDPAVAAGAAALRVYQRQYCADWFRQ